MKTTDEQAILDIASIDQVLCDAPVAAYLLNPEGIIIWVNRASIDLFGYSPKQFNGRHISEFQMNQRRLSEFFSAIHNKQSTKDLVVQFKCKNGILKWIRIDATAKWEGEKLIRIQCFVHEKSREIALENQLKECHRLLDEKGASIEEEGESEQRYRELYEKTPIMMHSMDKEGRLTNVSDLWLEVMEYEREEVLGRKTTDFLTESSRLHAIEIILPEYFKEKGCRDVPYQYLTKSGKVVDVELSAIAESNANGDFFRSIAVLNNVSARKLASAQNQLDQEILCNISEGVVLIQAETGKIIYCTTSLEKTFGYEPGELLKQNGRVLITRRFQGGGSFFEKMLDGVRMNGLWRGEVRSQRKDGSLFWSWASISTFEHFMYGEVWLVVQEDLTDRKVAEEALRVNKEVIDHMPIGVAVVHQSQRNDQMHYRFVLMNALAAEALEVPQNLTLEEIAAQVIPRALKEELFQIFSKIGDTGKSISLEHLHRAVKGGSKRVFSIQAVCLGQQNVGIIYEDISERLEMEAQLRQTYKMEALGTLAGGIAHDFNNILGVIIGNAELVIEEMEKAAENYPLIEEIALAGERAANLVRQILTFSRMGAIRLNSIRLSSVIQDVLKLIRATLPAHIQILQDLVDPCPSILGDITQIHQILLNLCNNARQAMAESGGTLEISLHVLSHFPAKFGVGVQPCLRLMVSDTGQGIPEDILEKIFDPFFTTKKVGEGTGLGLSVVHGIVKKHGGRIVAKSKLGEGSTFLIYFPLSEEVDSDHVIEDVTPLSSGANILLVEDEGALLKVYQGFLEKQGYRVTACRDGLEALTQLNQFDSEFDVLVTDQAMPNMTGKQLVKTIRAQRWNLPVIMVTGYSELMGGEEAKALGITESLLKPIKMQQLQKAIENCFFTS